MLLLLSLLNNNILMSFYSLLYLIFVGDQNATPLCHDFFCELAPPPPSKYKTSSAANDCWSSRRIFIFHKCSAWVLNRAKVGIPCTSGTIFFEVFGAHFYLFNFPRFENCHTLQTRYNNGANVFSRNYFEYNTFNPLRGRQECSQFVLTPFTNNLRLLSINKM